MRILRIADPSLNVGGAEKRAFNVLKHLSKIDDVELIPPLESVLNQCKYGFKELNILEREGVRIPEAIKEMCEVKLSKNPLFSVKQEIEYYYNLLEDVKDVDVIVVDHVKYNIVGASVFLKKKINAPLILLQQSALKELGSLKWNIRNRGLKLDSFLHPLAEIYVRKLWRNYSRDIDLVLGVSNSAINELFSSGYVERPIKAKVIKPANAVEIEKIDVKKENNNIAIYFSRLEPEKGIRDIPKIWKEVSRELPASLLVAGKFFSEKLKKEFLKNADENIKYLGFLNSSELQLMISKAKVFVYPTHGDVFSLSVLESLMLRTPVVTYDIPAIREIYGNIPAVKMVKEGDIKCMARQVINILKMSEEEIESLFDNEEVKEFLELHNSWEKVAVAEHKTIKEFLEDKNNESVIH